MILTSVTQRQRAAARAGAIEAVKNLAGAKPERQHYDNSSYSNYPEWLVMTVTTLSIIMLFVAFLPSAMRLNFAGATTFAETIDHLFSAQVAGAMTVSMSEIGAVLFLIASAVIAHNVLTRRILYGAALISLSISLLGNIHIALQYNFRQTPFELLEAFAPPLLTFATAFVLKEVALHRVAQRHADNLAYEAALQRWQSQTRDPEQHELFRQYYANELWDALKSKNKSKATAEYLGSLSPVQRSQLIWKYMQEDEWFAVVNEPAVQPDDTQQVQAFLADTQALEAARLAPTAG